VARPSAFATQIGHNSNVPRLRASEWLIVGYFLYVAITAMFFFAPLKAFLLAGAVFAVILVLARTKSYARDLAPLAFTLAAYREMDWFTPAVRDHHLEKLWVVWDRRLLNDGHLRAAVESLGALAPTYLELCYLLVYAVGPVAVALLFINHRRARIDDFLLAYLAGTLGAYAMFPFFPSEPPRTAFPDVDLPSLITYLRRFNLWILGGTGIHSSVFPSAHVSSAFSAVWGFRATMPDRPWIARAFLIYGTSVACATIYGRYHYAVDAVAGVLISLLGAAAVRLFSAPALPAPSRPARSA
jgi:membrane-associated phospholipid phosphatase